MTKLTWNTERTATLVGLISGVAVVTQADLATFAENLETTARSIGSKLRSLNKEGAIEVVVQKASDVQRTTWDSADEAALVAFLGANSGVHTYSELNVVFMAGKYSTKQLQGKILSLELTDSVQKAEKVVAARTYSVAEEAIYIEMASAGASLEAIAQALSKKLQSVRGKGLSLLREERITSIPVQEVSTAKAVKSDFLAEISDIETMTVADIAAATGKSERGIKNTLSRRGISCSDHDGASRRNKLDKLDKKDEA